MPHYLFWPVTGLNGCNNRKESKLLKFNYLD